MLMIFNLDSSSNMDFLLPPLSLFLQAVKSILSSSIDRPVSTVTKL
jgi:hypothetical protein